jgi:hypothetical protein
MGDEYEESHRLPLVYPFARDAHLRAFFANSKLCAICLACNSSSDATNGKRATTNRHASTPAKQNFGGLSFGVGLGLTLNVQNTSRVSQASVINGIVRVTQTDDAIAGIVLEGHYFFVPSRPFLWSNVPAGAWGHGPFVAIQASTGGSSSVVTAYGLGWMIGFREPTWTYTNGGWTASYGSSSWNFGVGLRVDPQAQVLGDGIVANQPLPAGETSVRFKTVPRYGIMLVSSFSF